MIRIRRALISVFDKTYIDSVAEILEKFHIQILSTGGTYNFLKEKGFKVISIEDITNFPEILGGRVKTLHPFIHAGLLARMDYPDHIKTLEDLGLKKIDLVIVNLYPFVKTRIKTNNEEEIIENIDIGGPAMLRSAAKNFAHTVVVCDIDDYSLILSELTKLEGFISKTTSRKLAAKVFRLTSAYDSMIADYFNETLKEEFPDIINIALKKVLPLRYGENPHQKATYYRPFAEYYKNEAEELGFKQLQGKELSFNNLLDLTSAFQCAVSLPHYGVAIVKHLNPSGAAYSEKEENLLDAFIRARNCDPVSAFGGIVGINGTVNGELAQKVTEQFVECIIAPSYTEEALKVFASKLNIRVIVYENPQEILKPKKELRIAMDGYLYEDYDVSYNSRKHWTVVTNAHPTEEDWQGLEFAWRVVKFVKSNAIVFTNKNATLAIGAGQMSRLDSAELALNKSIKYGISLRNSYAASDGFFPFKDSLEIVIKAGAKAVIQPGGSIRDQEVIDLANEYKIPMVFTNMRHFRH